MITLYRLKGGAPAPLPLRIHDEANNAFTAPFAEEDLRRLGFRQFGVYDPSRERIVPDGASWRIEAIPLAPPTPPAPARPRTLGRLEFIRLAQDAGGMSDALLVAAQADPLFAAFWIKFQMASAVERDDEITAVALGALTQAGYLPNGVETVRDAWPSE